MSFNVCIYCREFECICDINMGCSSSVASRSEHNIIPVTPQPQDDCSSISDCTLCDKHGGKTLTKYNERDNKLLCDVCISARRRGSDREFHKQTHDISEYVNSIKFKQRKIKIENDGRSKKRDIQSLLADANDNTVALEAQKCNLLEEIRNFRKAVIDILNHLCDELCERITSLCKGECVEIERRKKALADYLQKLGVNEAKESKVQATETMKLVHIIEMEKCLLGLSKHTLDTSFVDLQLKIHDNLSLRNLLQCDQRASTLGEVVLLRNSKSERPCTKELIVHDQSDIQQSDADEDETVTDKDDTITESVDHDTNETNARTPVRLTTPRADTVVSPSSGGKLLASNASTSEIAPLRSSTPRTASKRNSTADQHLDSNSRKVSRLSLRSTTPKANLNSTDGQLLSHEAPPDSTPHLTQSLTSSLSIMTPSAINFHTPFSDRKLFERNASLLQSFSLPVSNKTSDVTSSVVLPNGDIILCDRSNQKLWHFDPGFNHINDLWFKQEPHNMCTISESDRKDRSFNKIAISFPKAKLIQIVRVTHDTFEKLDEIRTEPECWGIDSKGKSLVFSTEKGAVFRDVGDYRNFRWRKYKYAFQKPISLKTDQDVIYVCNWGSEEVPGNVVAMYFDDRGKKQIKFSYSNRYLRRPVSCSVDNEDNIYICDAENTGIHQVSSDGSQYRILNINGGQTGSWQHVNFIQDSDYFLLTETGSNLLYICQMK